MKRSSTSSWTAPTVDIARRPFVRAIVEGCVQGFDEAPIQDDVPLLVIRKAMDELRRLDPLGSTAS